MTVPTRRRIFQLITEAAAPISVADLAAISGVHQNTVRLHLACLVDAGLVIQESRAAHGRGRPGFVYRAAAVFGPGCQDGCECLALVLRTCPFVAPPVRDQGPESDVPFGLIGSDLGR